MIDVRVDYKFNQLGPGPRRSDVEGKLNNVGIPALAALGDYEDELLTVREQILAQFSRQRRWSIGRVLESLDLRKLNE